MSDVWRTEWPPMIAALTRLYERTTAVGHGEHTDEDQMLRALLSGTDVDPNAFDMAVEAFAASFVEAVADGGDTLASLRGVLLQALLTGVWTHEEMTR